MLEFNRACVACLTLICSALRLYFLPLAYVSTLGRSLSVEQLAVQPSGRTRTRSSAIIPSVLQLQKRPDERNGPRRAAEKEATTEAADSYRAAGPWRCVRP